MNVVGRVGSLISQGVYSVATPFHPFGGAVDVIVVQQQDGTFRSTPWYVRFGKFQGVLKGAEKMVRISVNGVEANFHMYLDNSGEAFFLREADSSKEGERKDTDYVDDTQDSCSADADGYKECNGNEVDVHRLEHTVSDSAIVQLREECNSSCKRQIERAESESERRFYEIQNDHSPLAKQYDTESQASDSEVILVSVDGHVLTAPISGLQEDTENVQLCTPQFHLGPGEVCEDNEELCSGDDAWAADYFSKLNAATSNDDINSVCSSSKDDSVAFGNNIEVCECEGKQVHQAQETNAVNQEGDLIMQRSSEESPCINREDVFKSCVELSALVTKDELDNIDGLSPSSGYNSLGDNASPETRGGAKRVMETAVGTEHVDSDSFSAHSITDDPEWKDGQLGMSVAVEGTDNALEGSPTQEKSTKSEIAESQTANSCEGVQPNSTIRFEISLCGSELQPGMGLVAAAKAFDAHRVSGVEFRNSAESVTKNENLIVRFGDRYMPWKKAAHIVLGMAAFGLELPVEAQDAIPVEDDESAKIKDDSVIKTSSSRSWRLWPIAFRRVKTVEHTSSNSSNEDIFVDSESGLQNAQGEPASPGGHESPHKQFIRTNIPTNEQIASLNLKEGQNIITFSFSTRVLGTQQVDAHIYLWKWNARIVISDVDGTITKSDVLGQFMPLVGKDWTQSGVARLFTAIKENGYHLLFLSARAIVQAYLTRSYLLNLKQDGKALPNGPVVISPDGLLPSLYREVIRRAPHEFKIACLEDIRKLFPSDYNPFYAGFGNRDTDELSYRKMGIPKGKIFIINPKGEVAISRHCIDVKSYTSLHTLVNDMFPPTSMVEQEDFNNWNYWRMPLQEVDL